MTTDPIERRIASIEARNRRVEADKAWETSRFRVIVIAIGTYVAAMILLWVIQAPNPYLGALVPALGFTLSTLSLPALKRWWLERYIH